MGTARGHLQHRGTHRPLVQLEQEPADLHGKEASLPLSSGYVSNETGISTIWK